MSELEKKFYDIGKNRYIYLTDDCEVGLRHQEGGKTLERMFVHHADKAELLLALMEYNLTYLGQVTQIPQIKLPELEDDFEERMESGLYLLDTYLGKKDIFSTLKVAHSNHRGYYTINLTQNSLKFAHVPDPEYFGYTVKKEDVSPTIAALFEVHKKFTPPYHNLIRFAQEFNKIKGLSL